MRGRLARSVHAGGPEELFAGKGSIIKGIFEKLKTLRSEPLAEDGLSCQEKEPGHPPQPSVSLRQRNLFQRILAEIDLTLTPGDHPQRGIGGWGGGLSPILCPLSMTNDMTQCACKCLRIGAECDVAHVFAP